MRGVLLVNLGTPDAPTVPAVRTYLREFLMDPRVVDISALGRWALVNLVVLPFRPAKSAAAYQKVWRPDGSPLLAFSRELERAVQAELGGEYAVALGMRYGTPSLAQALAELRGRGVTELTVVPLYPQYASSSTGSSLERTYQLLGAEWNVQPVRTVGAFFREPRFLEAWEQVARLRLVEALPDHVLFSFHGLPERQILKSDPSRAHCLKSPRCCHESVPANAFCYRHQCTVTAGELARRLGLHESKWSISFQSRLGRTPWLKPYTDLVLPELAKKGIKRLAVMCPAFVADCLETLEEIGIRAREQWLGLGGEDLTLVPSLNAEKTWVEAVAGMVRAAA